MLQPFESMMNPQPAGQEYLAVDWAMFGELCRALALKVARDYDPEIIVGIARAGVIPAAVVASMLRVEFYSIKISRPDADDAEETVRMRPAIMSAAPRAVEGKRVLIVDEITTSGDTLRLALAAVRGERVAAEEEGRRQLRPALHVDALVRLRQLKWNTARGRRRPLHGAHRRRHLRDTHAGGE